jgi:Cu/Ag efflux pump CusA
LLFGIAVSTLLTLVVIPVLYYALFHKRHSATPTGFTADPTPTPT